MEEEWRAINGYEGLYEVSNMGRVKSLNYRHTGKEKILKPGKNRGRGYLYVILCKNGKLKMYTVHRLVAQNFAPCNNMDELDINHKDECKTNNNLSNLEWCTRGYNDNYGTRNDRIAEKNSIAIAQLTLDGKYIRSYKSSMDAQRLGGFTQQNIIKCCKGKRKTHGGYKWCYLHEYISKIDPRIKKIILFDKEYHVN